MTIHDELLQIIGQGENDTLEFKETTGQRTDAAKTVCAFLNTKGGRVIFGVTNDRQAIGQQIGDSTIEDVTQEIRRIDPPVYPTVTTELISEQRSLIIITADRGHLQPYTYGGKAYRRVGTTTQEMFSAERDHMLMERLHAQKRWENELAESVSIDALDISEITRTLEEAIRRGRTADPGTRDAGSILRGIGLMDEGRLLKAAVVLFGKRDDFLPHYPQCLLKLARFRGTDRTEFTDNRQFHGNAFELLQQAELFLRQHLPIAGRIVPNLFERQDDPLYPLAALREALANAICHRDYVVGGGSVAIGVYNDRLEIISSGPLPFGLTPEKLFVDHESRPWNPLIAHVFFLRGIIERWGRGTLKMAELTEQAGFIRPSIEERDQHVIVTFRPSQYLPPVKIQRTTSEAEQRILQYLSEAGPRRVEQIHEALKLTNDKKELREILVLLKGFGILASGGKGRGSTWFLSPPR
ncbi:MAG: RNA-binding domain-containing protein [Patescibacteria group bacterium]